VIPIIAWLAVSIIVIGPTVVFLLVRFRRREIERRFPGLLVKSYRPRITVGAEGESAESEVDEELSTLGRVLTSKRTWISAAFLQTLLVTGIAAFYLSAVILVWRIERNIVNSGTAASPNVSVDSGNATLEGPISTEDQYIEASRKAIEIIGPGHVINRMRVQHPEVLGEPSDQIGEAQIDVDTLYNDSPESIRQIANVLRLPLFENVTVKAGERIEQIVSSHFGIDNSKLPNSFRIVGHRIADLNSPNLPPTASGSIRIPILPTRFQARESRPSRSLPTAKQSIIGFQAIGITGSFLEVKVSVRPHANRSRRILLQVPFTRGSAVETQENASVLESAMTIQFAGSGGVSSVHKTLDGDDHKTVVDALKRQARRQATVFVLDSGWPDEPSYQSSIVEMRKLVDIATNFYNLDRVHWEDKPYTPLSLDDKSQHCVYIKNSLSEFTDLDSRHVVKVIYVPLDTKQNAKQILQEMLRLYRIRTIMQRDTQVDDDTKRVAQDFAAKTLGSIETDGSFDYEKSNSAMPIPRYRQRWTTNSAIAAAVWYLAELAAEQDPQNPVFFLNESWTVVPDTVALDAPGISSGIIVAAAGNTPGKEINTDTGKIDFAREATPAKNVLAALDTKPGLNQPFCDSSQLSQDTLGMTMAASYDGEALDGGLCGTSFSAPRIAWLLALREATRTEDLQQSEWAGRLQQKLISLRRQSPSMFEVLYLHAKDLLQ